MRKIKEKYQEFLISLVFAQDKKAGGFFINLIKSIL